jgi:2-iminobutanoate/2-iminopropanoate deaminase
MMHRLDPKTIHPPFARDAHGIEVPPGARLVFCSGQLGIDAAAVIPPGAYEQAILCFKAIEAILGEAGMDLGNLVRLNAYVTGREYLPAYMAARDSLLSGPPPASTLMIVSGFARPEFLVEVEAVAAKA